MCAKISNKYYQNQRNCGGAWGSLKPYNRPNFINILLKILLKLMKL